MPRTILYYPTIKIPNRSWLRNAVLYFDEVSSIIPQAWNDGNLTDFSPEIEYLIAERQFRPIRPESLIFNRANYNSLQDFIEEFTQLVNEPRFRALINRTPFRQIEIHRDKVINSNNSFIHSDKVSENVYDLLANEAIASRSSDARWIMFEANTALLYMSLLAKYLADIDENPTTIGTDSVAYERLNFKRVNSESGFPVVSLSLTDILPTPKPNISMRTIVDFKTSRRGSQSLDHFKIQLSEFQTRLSNCETHAELKDVVFNYKDSLVREVNDLNALMLDSNIQSVFKTVKSLIKIDSPTTLMAAATAINTKYNIVHLPLSLETIGIAAMGVIELTGCYIERRNQQRANLKNSPFSYVYLANKYGIIDRPR